MNDNLIKCRRALKISQTEMANIAGLKLTAYRYKEKGDKPFTQDEMLKIYKYLSSAYPSVTIEQLFFAEIVNNMITKVNIIN